MINLVFLHGLFDLCTEKKQNSHDCQKKSGLKTRKELLTAELS